MSSSGSDDDGGPKLPNDVAVEILKRLPARSLFRFRCVCRSWRSTIDDSRFVALHWSHSALDTSSRYLVCLDLGDDAVQSPCSLFLNESLTLPPSPRESKSRLLLPATVTASSVRVMVFAVGASGTESVATESLESRFTHSVQIPGELWNVRSRLSPTVIERSS
ncbi:F-box protein At1g30790-like [Eucalyptus grandis]|uniref:F-box protein At1g30790-like n=1 Tax=Eucalyptus grandis TaxID=71139 RepID=UPI00192F0058|nr:F-box protein At1g30790-like [Eucalyptus grandis]